MSRHARGTGHPPAAGVAYRAVPAREGCRATSRALGPTSVSRGGLRRCRCHDVRHSFATDLLLRPKVDVVTASLILAHFDPVTTARLHIHPDNEMREEAGMSQNRHIAAALANVDADPDSFGSTSSGCGWLQAEVRVNCTVPVWRNW